MAQLDDSQLAATPSGSEKHVLSWRMLQFLQATAGRDVSHSHGPQHVDCARLIHPSFALCCSYITFAVVLVVDSVLLLLLMLVVLALVPARALTLALALVLVLLLVVLLPVFVILCQHHIRVAASTLPGRRSPSHCMVVVVVVVHSKQQQDESSR